MGMNPKDWLGANNTQRVIRPSDMVEVTGIGTSAYGAYKAIHDTMITFTGLYVGANEISKIKEVKIKQFIDGASGESLIDKDLLLTLYNSDLVSCSAGAEVTFPSGLDEEDVVVARIPITTEDWINITSYKAEAVIKPDCYLEAGTTTDLYGVLTVTDLATVTPAASQRLYVKLFTELIESARDAS